MTTKETTKRTPSPEGLKKKAANRFIDADARLKKAEARQAEADAAVNAATEALKAARAECASLGVPIAGEGKP